MARLRVLLVTAALAVSALTVGACTGTDVGTGTRSARDTAVVRALPAPTLDGRISLERALATRRSVREFTDRVPTSAQVGQVLWAAQGITSDGGGRTAPSAGGLYALEVYVLAAGEVWRYRPEGHQVEAWTDVDAQSRLAAAVGQDSAADAPLLVVLTGVPDRMRDKYGDRAARYVLLEAGHAAQNVLLQATALGLGAVPIGAFDDESVATALGLPAGELAYYVIPVGIPAVAGL